MTYFLLSIETIFTILIAAGCGAFLARKNILHKQALKDCSNLLVYLILPSLIFSKVIYSINFSALKELWIFPVNALVIISFGLVIGKLLILFLDVQKQFHHGIIACTAFSNVAYIPLILISSILFRHPEIFGENAAENGVLYISLILLVFTPLSWTLGFSIITKQKLKNIKNSKFLSPPAIAIILAVILGLNPFTKSLFIGDRSILGMFYQATFILGKATLPLALIILGGNLARGPGDVKIKLTTIFYFALGKYFILPLSVLLFLFICKKCGMILSPMMTFVLMIEGFMPPAMNLAVMSQFAETNKKNVAALMFWMYLIAIPAMTIWLTVTMKLI